MISEELVEQTVVIQERSRFYRESMRLILPAISNFRILGVVADGEELAQMCEAHEPTAVLFEAVDVQWDVTDVVEKLLKCGSVLVGTYPLRQRPRQRRDGVTLICRNSSAKLVAAALQGSRDGPDVEPFEAQSVGGSETLTPREYQVLALISTGFTTAETASRLGISPKTVENRKQAIFSKLGVQNQSHAISVAMRSGLLGMGPLVRGRQ